MHFGATGAAVVGLIEENFSVRVEHAGGLAAFVNDAAERVEQAGIFQCELSVVVVDVEHAPLRACACRGFGLVDGGGDAMHVQDASERQSSETAADDRDR